MRAGGTIRTARHEAGIALLISIFILLLISVVAIALIVSSGTETSLAGNYRSSTSVYYAALAGIEEARGRLTTKDPNSFQTTWTSFYPSPGTTLPIGTVGYVLNPGPGDPTGPALLTTYPDQEYVSEFGSNPGTTKTINSVWTSPPLNGNLSFPVPLYKWVRINAVSEQSLKLADTYPFLDGTQDPTPLYYDGAHLNDTNSGRQVFEITALAVLPNSSGQSSQKLVQYLVAPAPINLPNFPAAITFVGNPANNNPAYLLNYGGPDSTTWFVNGQDSFRYLLSDTPSWSCTPSAPTVYALGYTNPLDNSYGYIHCCKVTTHPNNYTGPGSPGTNPSVQLVSMPPTYRTPAGFNNLVQSITQNADVVIAPGPPSYTSSASSDLTPLGMSSNNPLTVVVNGNLDFTGWHNPGYGLLLVTGNLNYDPDASWYGIVLVIGKGTVTGSRNGTGEFDGATMLAQTLDPSSTGPPSTWAPLGFLGAANMQFDDHMGGNGFYYSSCWINNSIPTGSYKVLSFHEIAQ